MSSAFLKSHFDQIADDLPLIVWVGEPQGRIVHLNRRFFEYTGVTPSPNPWDLWPTVVHPDDLGALIDHQKQLKLGIPSWEAKFRMRALDGSYQWFLGRSVAVRDPSGAIVGRLGTASNIHEQELAYEKEREAIRVRDIFMSMASHELRTPVSGLLLQMQISKRLIERGDPLGFEPARVTRLVDLGVRSLEKLGRLVEDMLDVSRIQTRRLAIEKERFDLRDLVKETASRFDLELSASEMDTKLELGDEPIVGSWDRLRIEQVLSNLITNAIRYAPRAPLRIRTEKSRFGHAVLEVRDHGPGIPEEAKSKVFDQFERFVSANEIGGLGLGLYITREIVALHGGTVRVESELGRGAGFVVELPC